MAIFDREWGRNSAPREGQKIPCYLMCMKVKTENSLLQFAYKIDFSGITKVEINKDRVKRIYSLRKQ